MEKHTYLSGFPFGTIRRISKSKIQKRKQRRKIETNQGNNNKQQGVNLRNLRQIPTPNRKKNEHVIYERIATVNIRSIKTRKTY